METSKAQGKGILMDNEDDEEEEDEAVEGDNKKKRAVKPYYCQVEDCITDLTEAKPYHRRHKVCEFHAKAPVVLVSGMQQRFCQQCSRFHQLSEFDEAKKSCRRRLAGHNERRRKSSYDLHEGRS